jgi:amino acid transporter
LRFGSATRFTPASLVPHAHISDLIFWSTIFFAFAGCECASFMGDEIKDARRIVPPALMLAGALITVAYIAGTMVMLIALPASGISGLSGFMTVMQLLCHRLGFTALVAPLALLVTISGVGAAAAYLSATARLPFVVGIHHYLPPLFARIHPRWQTPYVAIIIYGIAGVFFGVLSQAGTSVKGAYDLLVAMSVISYFIPFLFVFASMIRLQSRPYVPGTLRLPGGKPVAVALSCIGFFTTASAIVFSMFPAEDETHPTLAFTKIMGMTILLLLTGWLVYRRGQRSIERAGIALSKGLTVSEGVIE